MGLKQLMIGKGTLFVLLIILLPLFLLTSKTVHEQHIQEQQTVIEVIDGDTFQMLNGEKVRLICIDAPEQGEPFYEEAKQRLKTLILRKSVRLERDQRNHDRHGRLLRYVFLNTTFINKQLVAEGLARVTPFPPDIKYCELLKQQQNIAQQKQLGIWSGSWNE